MATFGDLERALADLYPYRWAIGAVVIVLDRSDSWRSDGGAAGTCGPGDTASRFGIISVPLTCDYAVAGLVAGVAAVHQRDGGRGVPVRGQRHGTGGHGTRGGGGGAVRVLQGGYRGDGDHARPRRHRRVGGPDVRQWAMEWMAWWSSLPLAAPNLRKEWPWP